MLNRIENILIHLIVFFFIVTLNHYTVNLSPTWTNSVLIAAVSVTIGCLIIRYRLKKQF